MSGDAMDDFITAYKAVIELYMLCYGDLIKQGMKPEDATRNAKAIMELVFAISKTQEDKNND